jgi:hypothetical protein
MNNKSQKAWEELQAKYVNGQSDRPVSSKEMFLAGFAAGSDANPAPFVDVESVRELVKALEDEHGGQRLDQECPLCDALANFREKNPKF